MPGSFPEHVIRSNPVKYLSMLKVSIKWSLNPLSPIEYRLRIVSLLTYGLHVPQSFWWLAVEYLRQVRYFFACMQYPKCGLTIALYRGMDSSGFRQDTADHSLESSLCFSDNSLAPFSPLLIWGHKYTSVLGHLG